MMKRLAALLVVVFCLSSSAFAATVMSKNIFTHMNKNVTVTKEAGSKANVTKTKTVNVKNVKTVKHVKGLGFTKRASGEAGPKK